MQLRKNPGSVTFAGGSATGGFDHLKTIDVVAALWFHRHYQG